MATRELTCIVCPRGCQLTVELEHLRQCPVGGKLEFEPFTFSSGDGTDPVAVTAGGFDDLHSRSVGFRNDGGGVGIGFEDFGFFLFESADDLLISGII